MRLHAKLPLDRTEAGEISLESDDGELIQGPFPCRGKADSGDAMTHGNVDRDPRLPYGDHPYGSYRITAIEVDKQPSHTYGPCFLLLDPIDGDALLAKQNGRVGIGIHGGDPGSGTNFLRATDGCLRVENVTMLIVYPQMQIGDVYVCEEKIDD